MCKAHAAHCTLQVDLGDGPHHSRSVTSTYRVSDPDRHTGQSRAPGSHITLHPCGRAGPLLLVPAHFPTALGPLRFLLEKLTGVGGALSHALIFAVYSRAQHQTQRSLLFGTMKMPGRFTIFYKTKTLNTENTGKS